MLGVKITTWLLLAYTAVSARAIPSAMVARCPARCPARWRMPSQTKSPMQAATGGGATIGLEDPSGSHAAKVGFNTMNAIVPGSSKLFTPQ